MMCTVGTMNSYGGLIVGIERGLFMQCTKRKTLDVSKPMNIFHVILYMTVKPFIMG